jgi:DNA-binding transcriptional ArsR family regulator
MSQSGPRQITDSRVLAALSHPLRRRFLDVLHVHGPATSSAIAGRTGQTVANVSHHMRVLLASGLVEEVPELARTRRERWWRLADPSVRWSTQDFAGDPAALAVAQTAQSLNLEQHVEHVRAWFAAPAGEQATWGQGAFSTDKWLNLTPSELSALSAELIAVLDRWAARDLPAADPENTAERAPVFLFAYGVPARP